MREEEGKIRLPSDRRALVFCCCYKVLYHRPPPYAFHQPRHKKFLMSSYNNSLHRDCYTREFFGYDEWVVEWNREPWRDARTGVCLAPGAKRNWPSASDNDYIAKERRHAILLAKALAKAKQAEQ